jgi:SNF2 family DNA or RNA helicase
LELAARNELKSLLVICLNSLQEKWEDELLNKFNIRLKKFESVKEFKKAIEDARNHGEPIFGIINFDKFRQKSNVDFFENYAIKLDLIIIDEAHILRNNTNARQSIQPFTDIATSLVLLTATPIMTSLENLFNLIRLLDSENFSNYQIFQNAINLNVPFIQAYKKINSGVSPNEIAKFLLNSNVTNIFKYGDSILNTEEKLNKLLKDDELFQSLIVELQSTKPLTISKKISIQEKLINLNSLNNFYTRTRKKDVLTAGNSVIRKPQVLEISMNKIEESIYQSKIQNSNDDIGSIQIKRKYSSSLFADNFTEEQYINGNTIGIAFTDSKYSALVEIVEIENKNQIIIFSFFRKTLYYLHSRLKLDGYSVGLIIGGMDLDIRNSIIDDFRENRFQILLSSEVGSTGLDMQFCSRMINYDLPWNPMVIEQRIGRIDRIGQQSEVINIFNFIYKNTIEEQIYNRLYERIGLFENSLGDLDEILGEKQLYLETEIENLYKTHLSKQEREKKLDDLASAFEKNKLITQTIEEGLKDSFSNDLYFQNEIESIEKSKNYITEKDLIELINRIIVNKLTMIAFNRVSVNSPIFEIQQPNTNHIFDFIEEYMDKNNLELNQIYRQFKIKNYSKRIIGTFNQEFAFFNKKVEYFSAYHPFINAISNYFNFENQDKNKVYRFGINIGKINTNSLHLFNSGFYFMVNYSFILKKTLHKKTKELIFMKSMVLDLNGNDISVFDNERNESFYNICQEYLEQLPEAGMLQFNEDLVKVLKETYTMKLIQLKKEFEINERLKFQSDITRRVKIETEYINKKIEQLNEDLRMRRGIESIMNSEINELQRRKDEVERAEKESNLSVNSKLNSLNYIYLYE